MAKNLDTIEELLHRRTDLSTFVVHFTRGKDDAEARTNLLSILTTGRLEARNAFGMAPADLLKYPEVLETQKVVCFTETPLEHAWMMSRPIQARRVELSGYGIAFTKVFARKHGANPVWYIDITPGHDWLTKHVKQLIGFAKRDAADNREIDKEALASDPVFGLTPFFEQMGTNAVRKEFWWEREWRHVRDLSFHPAEVVVVFAPEQSHEEIGDALAEHAKDLPGSRRRAFARIWNSKLVDPTWGLDHIIGTLARVEDLGPFPTGN